MPTARGLALSRTHQLLEAATRQGNVPSCSSTLQHLASQTGLADPWLARQQYKASGTARDCAEDGEHVFELGLARDQRLVRALYASMSRQA